MRLRILMLVAFLLSACDKQAHTAIPKPQKNDHEITVITQNSPNTYYIDDNNQPAGLEYDLVSMFVKSLGDEYSVKFIVVNNVSSMIPSVMKGNADFAAASLSVTKLRQAVIEFSKPYQTTQQRIIYNSEIASAPKQFIDLYDKSLAVPAGTSYSERLALFKQDYPQLHWSEYPKVSADELLEQVAAGTLDLTVADEHVVSMLQNFYPDLGLGMPLGKPEQIAWVFPKNRNAWMLAEANKFIEKIKKDGTLRNLIDRYYGHADRLNTLDVTTFLQRSRNLLPQYIPLFKQAQEMTGIDWRLIAAISYQESHWDRFNTSPTNVRGMMMLTEDTADMLGVTDRLDAKQSIMGGARYLLKLKDKIPPRITEPDRTWMTLAAYNIGLAHLEDARILAQRMKLKSDTWVDVKKTLPLLNKAEYYTDLKFGYANGGQPVVFVESIRTYHKILERTEPKYTETIPYITNAEKPIEAAITQYT